MEFPEKLRYTQDHEWVLFEDGIATIGITPFAGEELGELVFIELPEIGKNVSSKDNLCVVESTKAASDVYAPVSGQVLEVNTALTEHPEKVNADPYGEGWMAKLTEVSHEDFDALLRAEDYRKILEK